MISGPNLVSEAIIEACRFVPLDIYQQNLQWFPVPTVDFVVTRKNSTQPKEFLLALRTEEPFKGEWFVAGGRQPRGMTILNAVAYQAKRELDIDVFDPNQVYSVKFVGAFDVLNPASEGDSKRPE